MSKNDVEIFFYALIDIRYDAFPSDFHGSEVSELVDFFVGTEGAGRAEEGVERPVCHLISA